MSHSYSSPLFLYHTLNFSLQTFNDRLHFSKIATQIIFRFFLGDSKERHETRKNWGELDHVYEEIIRTLG